MSFLLGATVSVASDHPMASEAIQAQFKAMDSNGDGCLTMKEQMAWMINQRHQGALVGVLELPDEKLRQLEEKNRPIMEKADQDGNGCLTIEEVA